MSKPIQLKEEETIQWMRRLLLRANEIGRLGEVPITAVIVNKNGQCRGHGRNRRENMNDPLGHAELIALRQAAWIRRDWRFNDCTLIVNLEPCPMCAGALIQARMGQVIFGAYDPKRGALGGTIDLSKHKSSHHNMLVYGGVLNKDASELIKQWFDKKRKKT